MMNRLKAIYLFLIVLAGGSVQGQEWESLFEKKMIEIDPSRRLVPNALLALPSQRVAVSTTRGEVWMVDYQKPDFSELTWNRLATGLRKPGELHFADKILHVKQLSGSWTQLVDQNSDGAADLYRDLEKAPAIVQLQTPFRGVRWLPTVKKVAPYQGNYFGISDKSRHLSRLSKVANSTGEHYAMYVLEQGFRFAIDTITELPDQSWLLSQSNRDDPSRTRLRAEVMRLTWKKDLSPFEIKHIVATEKGVAITFTHDLNAETAVAAWAYKLQDQEADQPVKITKIVHHPESRTVELHSGSKIEAQKIYYLSCEAVWSNDRNPVRNPTALFSWKQLDQ